MKWRGEREREKGEKERWEEGVKGRRWNEEKRCLKKERGSER